LYFSADAYKNIITSVVDGTTDNDGIKVTFDNEVVDKDAKEGTLVTTTDFKLVDNNGVVITELKNYTTLYAHTTTKESYWNSSKQGGNDKWESTTQVYTTYYIVSKTTTELSMIWVEKMSDGYKLRTADMATAIDRARNFTKK